MKSVHTVSIKLYFLFYILYSYISMTYMAEEVGVEHLALATYLYW